MKIVFTVVFKKGYGGGVGRVAYEIAEYFSKYHDVVLICPGDTLGLTKGENGLKLFTIPSAGEGHACIPDLSQKNVRRLHSFLNAFKPDIIHAHEQTSISLICQVWALQNKVPFFYTAHVLVDKILDFGAKDMLSIFNFKLTESFLNNYFNTFLKNCDAVIALNEPVEESIRRVGFKHRIFRIPNGRNLSLYQSCRFADITSEPKILTFVGSLGPRKNQIFLLEVLKCLPENYILQLVGSALIPHEDTDLHDFVTTHHLEKRVVFSGEINHLDIPKWLEKTHVFVSASQMEVQSLVILEALASGRPVVGLSNETVNEVVDDEVGARLPKEATPQEFAQQVLRICQLPPEKYAQICQSARQRVSHLDWYNIMNVTIDAYNQQIQNPTPYDDQPEARLNRMLDLIHSQKVRDLLTQSFSNQPFKRVSPITLVYSSLTILLSAITYFTVKMFTKPGKAIYSPKEKTQ